jgi:hypothetical protein
MRDQATSLSDVIKQWVGVSMSRITPILERRGRSWCVSYSHEWDDDEAGTRYSDVQTHTRVVEWSVKQLEHWPNCRRMAYDMWYFNRKIDAEKFITLCNLRWA